MSTEKTLLSPVQITKKQREWIKKEKERTGNSIATIIRNLIQEKISES